MGDDDAHTGRHRTGRGVAVPDAGDVDVGPSVPGRVSVADGMTRATPGDGARDRGRDPDPDPKPHLEADPAAHGLLVAVPGAGHMAQIGVGARAVGGMVLVVVLVLGVLGGRWWWVEQRATAVPATAGWAEDGSGGAQEGPGPDAGGEAAVQPTAMPPGGSSPAGSTPAGAAPGGQAATAAETAPGPLLVHVIGQVAAPGVVELEAGARVVDAVDAAGGLTSEADAGSVNLARAVVDGEQVWVGAPGEDPPPGWVAGAPATGPGPDGDPGSQGAGSDSAQAPTELLDLNTATQADLEELPDVGPVTAGRILQWREEHGAFTAVAELLEVSGIGERTLEQLEPLVTVAG
ncbi:ComEA family DNA-binding protein [Serinicoccus marinus]|uniref:ComEA family DNA-binding protein n=1 Tax=Serinicoccus marinus TaxID=247333 RepID=UPI002492250F|nr:ComEA family DNA-binding protein [Serinicoccus marinus]